MSSEDLRMRRRYGYAGSGPGWMDQLDADARVRKQFLAGGPVTRATYTETRGPEDRAVEIELERAPYLSADPDYGALGGLLIAGLQLLAAAVWWAGVWVVVTELWVSGRPEGIPVAWLAAGLWLSLRWRGHHDSPAERVLLFFFALAAVVAVVVLGTAATLFWQWAGLAAVVTAAAIALIKSDL